MSQLIISRLLKPSICKNVIRHNKKIRMFSSKPTHPYMLIDHILNAKHCYSDQVYYDGEDKDKLVIKDKGLAEDVRDAMTVGFSRNDGWRVNLEKSEDDSTSLMLVNNTVKHYLPPLHSSSRIHNVATSNSPDIEKEDVVVAVKFFGSQVSLCKPFSESGSSWTNINTSGTVQPFSSLMYSKKNKKFVTVCLSGECFWSVDLHFDEEKDVEPKFPFLFNDEDSLTEKLRGENNFERYIWSSRTDHLVESPSGEHFLVKWFVNDISKKRIVNDLNEVETITQKTDGFLVFRVDTISCRWYLTQDIGDLCIFLGHSEAFCVPASSSPGLMPNSIYYTGFNFGVHNIATETNTTFFHTEEIVPLRSTEFPYWPPPLSY